MRMDKEARKAYQRAHYLANREKVLARSKARYAANREDKLAKQKERRGQNAEKIRAARQAYAEANGDEIRARQREGYRKNRARKLEEMRAYRAKPGYRDEQRVRNQAWWAANPTARADYWATRRARLDFGQAAVRILRATVWERDGGLCRICGLAAVEDDWHLDHIVPLACGGKHDYDNVGVTHPACNLRKGAADPRLPDSDYSYLLRARDA